jgi:hypothetical protein
MSRNRETWGTLVKGANNTEYSLGTLQNEKGDRGVLGRHRLGCVTVG